MKAIIMQIIKDITALTLPLNPTDIKRIFATFPEFNTTASPPTEMEKEWTQLMVIYQSAEDGVKLNAQLEALRASEQTYTSNIQRHLTLQKELVNQNEQIAQFKKEIFDLYSAILPEINASISKLKADFTPYTVSVDTKTQIEIVMKHLVRIKNQFLELKLPAIKIQLLQLNEVKKQLIGELNSLGLIIPGKESAEWFKDMASLINDELKKYQALHPRLEALQMKFANRLACTDVQNKIEELTQRSLKVEEELQAIQKKIDGHVLSKDKQTELLSLFKASTNVEELIASYKNKLSTVLSNLNPASWISWYYDKEYDLKQAEYTNAADFLTLHQQLQAHDEQSKALLEQQQELAKLLSNGANEIDQKGLIEEAIALINSFPIFEGANTLTISSPATDFYLALLANVPLTCQKIEQKLAVISKIERLIPILIGLEGLRTTYNLVESNDAFLLTKELLEKMLLPEEEQIRIHNELQRQQDLCTSCVDKAKTLSRIFKKRTALDFDIKVVLAELAKTTEPFAKRIGTLEEQIKIIQEIMAEKFQRIKADEPLHNATGLTTTVVQQQSVVGIDSAAAGTKTLKQEQDNNLALLVGGVVDPSSTATPLIKSATDDLAADPGKKQIVHEPVTAAANPITETVKALISSMIDSIEAEPQATKKITAGTGLSVGAVVDVLAATQVQIDSSAHGEKSTNKTTMSTVVAVEPVNLSVVVDKPGLKTDPVIVATYDSSDAATHVLSVQTATEQPGSQPAIAKKSAVKTEGIDESQALTSTVASATVLLSSNTITVDSGLAAVTAGGDLHTKEPDKSITGHTATALVSTTIVEPLLPNQTEREQLKKWHQFNSSALEGQDEELRNWYAELYSLAEEATKNIPFNYQYSHLIQDLFFGLQHYKLDTINAYRRLCPNPQERINVLLTLKPTTAINEALFNEELELEHLPPPLKTIYAHYKKLKTSYPVEAELLLRAMHALSPHLCDIQTNKTPLTQIPSILQDPCYEPLQRHRGFLRLWELIEDFFRLIIGKISGQAEHEYRKKPCFFKTCSAQLLEEADSLIQEAQPAAVY